MNRRIALCILLFFITSMCVMAQNEWVSYHATFPTKEYEGRKFKLSAQVRIEPKDTNAFAQLFARVDTPTGRGYGFFDNMEKRPIRSAKWQVYTIEGTIDSNSTQLTLGVRAYYAGSFFYDNLQLDIETPNEGWKTFYKNDFENGQVGLKQGTGRGKNGISLLYNAFVVQVDNSRLLKIEGQDAIDYYKNELLTQKEDTNRVNTLFKIADVYVTQKNREQAIDFFDKALQLSQKIGFEKGSIRYYRRMYSLYAIAPINEGKMIEMYKAGVEYSQKVKSREDIAFFALWLSDRYSIQGNYPEQLKYTYIALKEYEYLRDTTMMSSCYNGIGYYMTFQKNYSEAIKNHTIALRLRQSQNNKNLVGQSLVNLCDTYLKMSQLDSAQFYITQAIDLYTNLGTKAISWGLPLSYLYKASLNFKRGEIAEQKNNQLVAQAYFKEALTYYQKSQKLYRTQWNKTIGDHRDIDIGKTYYKLNNIALADSFLRSGAKHIERINEQDSELQEDRRDVYYYLSKVDSIRGDWKMAHLHYKRYIVNRDSLYNEENTRKTTAYQMQYEFELKEAATKAEQEKKELALQKEIELKALNYEYEKKQAAAKTEKEKQQLKYEQQLRQQKIEADYAQKVTQIEAEQKRKEAIAKVELEKKEALNASALALSQAEVQRKSQERNYSLIGLALLSALLGFIVYGYFQKQKANGLLQQQKEEIDHKSHQLEKSLTELKATQNQLIQKEKLASLGELTAGIAHEIQNPLNFVNNFSELSVDLGKEINEEIEKAEIDKEYVKELMGDLLQNQAKINHHGKRASSIVKGMLEHSRMGTGERVLTDFNKLADEYLRLSYHGLRAKSSSFQADYELIAGKDLPLVKVVPQELGRVLLNLMNNAFYAVAQSGKPNPKVIVKSDAVVSNDGSAVEIRIQDNGVGIPEAIKDKIFQPFFTTKPTGEGTGLGLSLSYDIITKGHNGTIEVESVEGEGTTFTIKLPLSNHP
ncbi:MAG: ATP-binding protein [Spirosomataceae bacterium]